MRPRGSIKLGALVAVSVGFACLLPTAAAASTGPGLDDTANLKAYLDGRPIPLADVAQYYCDDFSYPVIECSVSPLITAARATLTNLLTSVDYVTVFDGSAFSGAYMNISQDYNALVLLGWNDRISSFKARNGETGTFYVDWLYGGSQWSFCCNTQQTSLGGYDNSFSSVQRT